MSSVSIPNIDALIAEAQNDLQEAKNSSFWDPPNGNYELLLTEFKETIGSNDAGEVFPKYAISFEIMDAKEQGLERNQMVRRFSLEKNKGRGFRLLEMVTIAGQVKGEPINGLSEAIPALKAAADKEDVFINCEVRREKATNGKEYPRYSYTGTAKK